MSYSPSSYTFNSPTKAHGLYLFIKITIAEDAVNILYLCRSFKKVLLTNNS